MTPDEGFREPAGGILLAAGASTRMGRPKQLLPVGGEPMLSVALRNALSSDLHRVVLVLGHEAPKIEQSLGPLLCHPKLCVTVNPHYRGGISTSIRAGLDRIRGDCGYAMFLLADMPFVGSSVINRLLHTYLASGLPLGAVFRRGRRSHPVIVGRALFGELDRLIGDAGGRSLFRKYADQVCRVPAPRAYDDRDIDTWEAYEALQGDAPKRT